MGDFGAAAVLITLGAILGKHSLMQLWILATLEIIFYGLNEAICIVKLGAVDIGGSMFIHTFGAYFGLAASYFFENRKAIEDKTERCGGGYTAQYVSMIGTLFLFMYWPSFNGALAADFAKQRVVVNTVLAITSSAIAAFSISRLFLQRLDMEVVLNATLAGGVAIGCSADLVVAGGTAMILGTIAGCISAIGFLKLGPFLKEKINLHDTCGVHNLHGMPGILGGIYGAVTASLADSSFANRSTLEATFPKMAEGRTTSEQGWYQLAALGVTIGIAISSGALSGFIANKVHKVEYHFDDKEHFQHADYDKKECYVKETEMHPVAPDSARANQH